VQGYGKFIEQIQKEIMSKWPGQYFPVPRAVDGNRFPEPDENGEAVPAPIGKEHQRNRGFMIRGDKNTFYFAFDLWHRCAQ
jgi:hypothetical protein